MPWRPLLIAGLANALRILSLVLYRMVKRIQRAVTGRGAVERICGCDRSASAGAKPAQCMSVALWSEWSTSKQLAHIFAEHGKQANMDVHQAANAILGVKRKRRGSPDGVADDDNPATGDRHAELHENLTRCLVAIRDLNALKAAVEALRAQPFCEDKLEHEDLLSQLWTSLVPGRERQGAGRISKDWGLVGFQQRDPASDFRGGGMLGLQQLAHIASTRTETARRMLTEPAEEAARYPWACVGINVTMETLALLRSSHTDAALIAVAHTAAFSPRTTAAKRARDPPDLPRMLLAYHNLYADMFEAFHARWIAARPENVLAFKPIFEKSMEVVRRDIERDGRVQTGIDSSSSSERRRKSE